MQLANEKEMIEGLIDGRLCEAEALELLELIGAAPDLPTLSFVIDALKRTLVAAARSLEEIPSVLDCSGTGGSGLPHFNTSTTASFILAAGGVRVAKFGNRAAQSQSGSFDLLERLGIPLTVEPKQIRPLLDSAGLVFLFAPQFYPTLAALAPVRRRLGKRTVFNLIGPLLNPLAPAFRLMGVADEDGHHLVAQYLITNERTSRALVVRSENGLDELDPKANNFIYEVLGRNHPLRKNTLELEGNAPVTAFNYYSYNGNRSKQEVEQSQHDYTAEGNYLLFNSLISNRGPQDLQKAVCLNAGAGFVAAGRAADIDSGAKLAEQLISSGEVKQKFDDCRRAYARATG